MPEIELNLGNSKVKFEDIVANGLSRFLPQTKLNFFALCGLKSIAFFEDCVLIG